MKDDALKALKRSARAILKDELSAMRKELKELRAAKANCHETISSLQIELRSARYDLTACSTRLNEIRTRASKAEAWAQTHALPQGNRVAHCLAQWVNAGCSGPSFGIVHPFDRWGITPKP